MSLKRKLQEARRKKEPKCKKCNDTGIVKSKVKITDTATWDYICDCEVGKEWKQKDEGINAIEKGE